MNKIIEFLKNIKFELPKNIKLPPAPKLSIRQMIFWGVVLVVAVGLFIFSSSFIACWQLTALPGIAPASCGGVAENREAYRGKRTPLAGGLE